MRRGLDPQEAKLEFFIPVSPFCFGLLVITPTTADAVAMQRHGRYRRSDRDACNKLNVRDTVYYHSRDKRHPQRGAMWVDMFCIFFTVPEERVVQIAGKGRRIK